MKRRRLDPELTDAGRACVLAEEYTLITPSLKNDINFLTLETETSIETEMEKEMDVERNVVEKAKEDAYIVQFTSDEDPSDTVAKSSSEEEVSATETAVIKLPTPLKTIKRPCSFGGVIVAETRASTGECSAADTEEEGITDPNLTPHVIDERLFDFVYKAGASSKFHLVAGIFNKPLNVGDILLQHSEDLADESARFSRLASQSRIDLNGVSAMHVQDCVSSKKNRSAVYKKCSQLPASVMALWCPKHSKACKLIYDPFGFLLYLHSRYLELCENPTEILTHTETGDEIEENKTQLIASEQHQDLVEQLQADIESSLVNTHTITAIEQTFPVSVGNDVTDPNHAYLMLPMLPCFKFDGKSYILLSDIQKLFEIREDTALGILAHNLQDCDSFIEEDGVEEEQMEFSLSSFECLSACFEMAKKYKETLPTEKEFTELQTKMKLFDKPDTAKRWLKKKPVEENSSIDLYRPTLLELDEAIEEADDFLMRHTREYHGRDAALSHYLQDLVKGNILVYHNNMSRDGVLANFVMKTLARFLGGFPIPQNYDKIILVERLTALDCFGYQAGHVGSRRSYFYTYTALALSMGIESPEQLMEYGKHMMLRYRKPVLKELEQKKLQT